MTTRALNGTRLARVVICLFLVPLLAVSPRAGAEARKPSGSTPPHVMTIMMENTDYGQFVDSNAMPFMNEMAHEYADFTNAYGWRYPSLPNYIELLAGSDHGVTTDCDITEKGCGDFNGPTLVTQLEDAGVSWSAYYQGLSTGCLAGHGSGNYPYWHNAFRYFADYKKQCSHITNFDDLISNLSSPDAADFQWVVPDLVNSGGDKGTMASGDSWLAGELPKVMATSWYKAGGQIVILYDTGYRDAGGNGEASGGHIPLVVVSAHDRGLGAVSTPVNTAGVLHSIEESYGLAYLGNAAQSQNGSLGKALVTARVTGSPAPESEVGAVMALNGSTGAPSAVTSLPSALSLDGVAEVPAPAPADHSTDSVTGDVVAVGETGTGEGVVVSSAGAYVDKSTSDLESVACAAAKGSPRASPERGSVPPEGTCYAVGLAPSDEDEAVLVRIVGGRPVSTTPLRSFIGLYGIACPTTTTCFAVGYGHSGDADAVTTITRGVAGQPVEVKKAGEWLNSISCPTSTRCYAAGLVDKNPAVVPITSGRPGTPVTVPDAWYLNGIDCPVVGRCAVVGEDSSETGIFDTLTGSAAATPTILTASEYLYGVTCSDVGVCLVTGAGKPAQDGYSSAFVGRGRPYAIGGEVVPSTNGFGQIACGGSGLTGCVSVGSVFPANGAGAGGRNRLAGAGG